MSRYKAVTLRRGHTALLMPVRAVSRTDNRRRPAPAKVPSRHEEDTPLSFHRQSKAIKHIALLFYLPALVVLGLIIAD